LKSPDFESILTELGGKSNEVFFFCSAWILSKMKYSFDLAEKGLQL